LTILNIVLKFIEKNEKNEKNEIEKIENKELEIKEEFNFLKIRNKLINENNNLNTRIQLFNYLSKKISNFKINQIIYVLIFIFLFIFLIKKGNFKL
jgi:hypothetical protein